MSFLFMLLFPQSLGTMAAEAVDVLPKCNHWGICPAVQT
jgi:hypothetical protein